MQYSPRVNLSDLTTSERETFVGLVRYVVRADGRFSVEEVDVLSRLAFEIGRGEFWALMRDSASRFVSRKEVLEAAATLVRPEMRGWMYQHLVALAAVDGIHPKETDFLEQLQFAWGI